MSEVHVSALIEALLAAHVRHELSRWCGAELPRTIEAELGGLFRWLRDVKLDELSTRAQIMRD